ncbi:selenocysteine lyase/cysteine desulfurase [Variovorax sp. GrIS 2.14]|uniref:hypothetical protein n=1 Tax=Variovorax sp. GrIS 2.14 TaxID=3071709 RepID=UPI0038F5FDCB
MFDVTKVLKRRDQLLLLGASFTMLPSGSNGQTAEPPRRSTCAVFRISGLAGAATSVEVIAALDFAEQLMAKYIQQSKGLADKKSKALDQLGILRLLKANVAPD